MLHAGCGELAKGVLTGDCVQPPGAYLQVQTQAGSWRHRVLGLCRGWLYQLSSLLLCCAPQPTLAIAGRVPSVTVCALQLSLMPDSLPSFCCFPPCEPSLFPCGSLFVCHPSLLGVIWVPGSLCAIVGATIWFMVPTFPLWLLLRWDLPSTYLCN